MQLDLLEKFKDKIYEVFGAYTVHFKYDANKSGLKKHGKWEVWNNAYTVTLKNTQTGVSVKFPMTYGSGWKTPCASSALHGLWRDRDTWLCCGSSIEGYIDEFGEDAISTTPKKLATAFEKQVAKAETVLSRGLLDNWEEYLNEILEMNEIRIEVKDGVEHEVNDNPEGMTGEDFEIEYLLRFLILESTIAGVGGKEQLPIEGKHNL